MDRAEAGLNNFVNLKKVQEFDNKQLRLAMFDELAERSLMSPLAGTKHTYVRLATIVYCQILALFSLNLAPEMNIYHKRNKMTPIISFLTSTFVLLGLDSSSYHYLFSNARIEPFLQDLLVQEHCNGKGKNRYKY